MFIDEPIYPLNAELYDEFVYEVNGYKDFDLEGFISWLVRIFNSRSTECRIDTKWEDDCDLEVYYLRSLTRDEKAELGY
jgi:hypothetical protein